MNKDYIIQRGDTAKYQLTITHADFDQQRDPFWVVLHYGMTGDTLRISRDEMLCDEEGHWFMMFPSVAMTGHVKAETHYMVTDSDVDGGVREEVEWSWLGFVTDTPCPQFSGRCLCGPGCCADHVTFTRVWRNDANSLYLKLRTSEGEAVLDSEGHQLRVKKQESELY